MAVVQLKLVEPVPKKARAKSEKCTLSTYLSKRKEEGKKPFDDDCGVVRYVRLAKLPDDFVKLAWLEFIEQHTGDGRRKATKQKDWPATFLNCLKSNWYRYWKINSGTGEYYLTSEGHQARIVQESKHKEKQQ